MGISAYDNINYAQFNPLSMQEIFTPAAAMREQHDRLAEEYAAQNTATSLSLLGLKEGVDDEAIKIQKSLIDETRKASDELATKGFIGSGRRKNLYGLKQRYNSEIVPLQNQLKIRQERAEELRKIQLQDQTFRATMNPNEIGLTAGLKNPDAFNYDGVSGNQMYSYASKKLEQLSKVIDQKIPELKKMPGLSFQYFTAIQSGANPNQVANAMKQNGYDPTVVDKMTNMIHGTIESTMQEFGVYDKFKNNPDVINELWNSTSQAAFNALGQRQFGQVHDSWSEAMATKALTEAPPEPPGKTHMEYDAAFDEKNFKELNSILYDANYVKPKNNMPANYSSPNMLSWQTGDTDLHTSSSKNNSQQKINQLAHQLEKNGLLVVPKKVAVSELPEWNKMVIETAKEQYRTANKSRHFFNPSEETVQKFTAALSSTKDIVDINGDKVDKSKIFSSSGKLIGDSYLVRGVNGTTTLKTTDKEGNQVSIPFDISKLGSVELTDLDRDVRVLTDEQIFRKYNQYGFETKQDLEDEIDRILTSEQYTQTKSQNTNPGYTPYR